MKFGVENPGFLDADFPNSRVFLCLDDFLDEDFLEWFLEILESDLDLCFAEVFCSFRMISVLDLLSKLSPILLLSSPSGPFFEDRLLPECFLEFLELDFDLCFARLSINRWVESLVDLLSSLSPNLLESSSSWPIRNEFVLEISELDIITLYT